MRESAPANHDVVSTPIRETHLPLPLFRQGKVRDVYEVDAERLLLVASDRVSAFDVVMREPVPHKGAVLTQLTAWWLTQLARDVPHHLISADPDAIVAAVPALARSRALLVGRAMLVHRTDRVPDRVRHARATSPVRPGRNIRPALPVGY